MKRYNIHLEPEWMKELDKILKELKDARPDNLGWWDIKRADLIRFAIRETFSLSPDSTYSWYGAKIKALKGFIKKRGPAKGV